MHTHKQIKIKKPNKLSAFFICLIIATALWLLHSLNTVYTKQFTFPVEFLNYPNNKVTANEIPKELYVSVKASGLKLFLIGLNEPFSTLKLDFNEIKSNQSRNRFYLSSQINSMQDILKFNATIKSVYPDTIAFVNKAGTQKEVVVKVPLFVKYAQGFTSSNVNIDPIRILINGEEKDLREIDTVYTSPLYLNDLKSNFNKNLAILNSNPKIVLTANNVALSIVVDKLVERELSFNLRTINSNPNFKYVLFPSKVKVKVTTAFNRVSEIDTSLFNISVNIAQKRNKKLPVSIINVPAGIHVIDISPKEVEFLMIKRK